MALGSDDSSVDEDHGKKFGTAPAMLHQTKSEQHIHDVSTTPILDITQDLSTLFLRQVQLTPDAVALEECTLKTGNLAGESRILTYAQLNRRVLTLARRLRGYGVKRDSLVGVLAARSANYVIACLAALRAGGAFLVLEVAYPPALLSDVIQDAKPVVVVTDKHYASQVEAEVPLIVLDADETKLHDESLIDADPMVKIYASPTDDLEKLAFVCYTSGTTGRPKGICNPHRAAVLSYDLRFRLNDVRPGDRVACNAFFIWEMLRPLLRGATVVIIPERASYDPLLLVGLLADQRITETLLTPTLLSTILTRHEHLGVRLPDLRTLWLNGEVLMTELAKRALAALSQTRLLNCYSASETHEIACGDIRAMLDENATYCPVGLPMNPEQTYVLAEHETPVEAGYRGELYVGGSLLARGYLNLPDTTAKAFRPNPFDQGKGSTIYRTGDEARILPSGLLEITGRVGGMVKVRGYSVVPGTVESVILQKLSVSHCAVVAHGDGTERQLVAYFVRDRENSWNRPAPEVTENGFSPKARATLSQSLAAYMIPALWVELPALPTNNVSGKLDFKRLPAPKTPSSLSGQITPIGSDTDTSDGLLDIESLAKMWSKILKTPLNGKRADLDFFDVGGHSLALAELSTGLSKAYGVDVHVSRLAERPSLAGHLDVVRSLLGKQDVPFEPDLSATILADSQLNVKVRPHGTTMCPLDNANVILLTGATGFLGAFLLNELLQTTSAQIVCMMRFNKPTKNFRQAGIARLRRNLIDLGQWRDEVVDRVDILPTNLGQDRLGLGESELADLAGRVQVIVHAAATVNLVYPYSALRKANVEGTREIIRLACQRGATLHYISTNGVLPASDKAWPEDAKIDHQHIVEAVVDGYGQTKYVAEQLVLEAGRRGLPIRIYRLGTISGHSGSGSTNEKDLLSALVVKSLQMGYAPQTLDWKVEMTPVDYVSKAIVTLSKSTDSSRQVFHLGNRSPIDTDKLFNSLASLGFPTKRLAWDEWLALSAVDDGDGVFPADIFRTGMSSIESLKHPILLDDAATLPLISSIERPQIEIQLLETYARHWFARGWLPQPPVRRDGASIRHLDKGRLQGRVAVVTGASSGIGGAVAVALAREGAHVVLAARRRAALETVQKECQRIAGSRGSRILVHETDVTSHKQVASLAQYATETLGPVDILVSCAGVMYFTMLANAHTEEWERTIDVNCKGLLHCFDAFVPSMVSRSTGHVVAISSDAGRKVFPGLGAYSASKFFVEAALQSLRLETAASGLRVTSVQPGNTATDLLGMSSDKEAIEKYGMPTGAKILEPSDVANSIIHAVCQPQHVAVNEVLVEPREEPI